MDRLIASLLLPIFILFCIVPNTLRIVTIPVFVLAALLIFIYRRRKVDREAWMAMFYGSLVTLIYAVIGLQNGYPEALPEVLFVYMISPICWIVIGMYVVNSYTNKKIVNLIVVLLTLGALSVPALFAAYVVIGPESVSGIVRNVEYRDGFGGILIHVLGPIMFLIGGLCASPSVVPSRIARSFVFLSIFAATAVSGRTAMFIAYGVGALVFLVNISMPAKRQFRYHAVFASAIAGPVVVIVMYYLLLYFDFDVGELMSRHMSSLLSGGGSERTQQTSQFLQGINDSYALGVGHGVGLDIVRAGDKPWRYETLWLATVYRVGLIGALIYAAPVIYCYRIYIKSRVSFPNAGRSKYDTFMIGGLSAMLMASYTNPYLESFDFQWMIFFPFCYFVACSHLMTAEMKLRSPSRRVAPKRAAKPTSGEYSQSRAVHVKR